MNLLKTACLAPLAAALAYAGTATVNVAGSATPWLAGMPNGSTCCSGDSAPGQSPVLVPLMLIPGTTLTFTVTGTTAHGPTQPLVNADGRPNVFGGKSNGAENGISSIRAQLSSLVGVFLDNSQPDLSPAPAPIDFSLPGGMDFLSLAPVLKQAFFIGDGLTSGAVVQTFIVPVGATRLYLGTMDGFEWNNNRGELSVTVSGSMVPEPGTLSLVALAVGVALTARRRR